jgi:putative glycosyltransferase (TIGR04348 family)
MKILIVTPAPPRSRKGNRITAIRWARILKQLGHNVELTQQYQRQHCDVMIAIHARRSSASVKQFREENPQLPLILTLSGTDLYDDMLHDASALRSCELADRLILLQPHGIRELPASMRKKSRVIYQSVPPRRSKDAPLSRVFEVSVIGHLRPVKDPFRTALAARDLPETSRIVVNHMGAALTDNMAKRAQAERLRNPRYRWLGELPRWDVMRRLARSRLLVLSSKMEGGANVISEAVVAGVPVISSRISGSIGLLGEKYPGYFEVGITRALTNLLERAEAEKSFLAKLTSHCRNLKPLFEPKRERDSWQALLEEFSG